MKKQLAHSAHARFSRTKKQKGETRGKVRRRNKPPRARLRTSTPFCVASRPSIEKIGGVEGEGKGVPEGELQGRR